LTTTVLLLSLVNGVVVEITLFAAWGVLVATLLLLLLLVAALILLLTLIPTVVVSAFFLLLSHVSLLLVLALRLTFVGTPATTVVLTRDFCFLFTRVLTAILFVVVFGRTIIVAAKNVELLVTTWLVGDLHGGLNILLLVPIVL